MMDELSIITLLHAQVCSMSLHIPFKSLQIKIRLLNVEYLHDTFKILFFSYQDQ